MSNFVNPLLNVSRIELVYKNKVKRTDRVVVTSPEDAAIILRMAWDESKIELLEEFKILLLDVGRRCLGLQILRRGDLMCRRREDRICDHTTGSSITGHFGA